MNPLQNSLFVERVVNGWVVHAEGAPINRRDMGDKFVAKTPSDLAALLYEWATGQDKKE